MKTILFTNARDEDNILEWVSHHLNLGFSHIYIFDHKSIISLDFILNKIPKDLITIKRINIDIIKTHLMKEAYKIAIKTKFNWMLYLDCDEFLTLNNEIHINNFLIKYKDYDQIGINWLLFGSNNLNTIINKDKTIIESYTKCEGVLNQHIKCFLNLNMIIKNPLIDIPNPHVFIFKNMNKSIGTNYKLLDKNNPYFFQNKENYRTVSAFIAHYVHQSYETYIKRKIKLPRDDNNQYRSLMQKDYFHSLYNNEYNLLILEKYNNNNKNILNKYNVINN